MNTVLAALDCSAADRPVIETALGVADLLDATVRAVHVGEGPAVTAEGAASTAGVPLHLLTGPVVKSLLAELDAPDVTAGVLGARGLPIGRRPAGGTVLEVLEHTDKPVVVVPPEADGVCPRLLRRLLIPLDATELTSARIADALDALVAADTELVVLHVFDERARPPILNHGGIEFEQWGKEFLLRHLPGRHARFEWRSGHAADFVVQVGEEHAVDLVVVAWAQTLEGHGDIIRALLSRSKVPVLILPTV
jgi:nucleotide-binding universal stress UspA family protein